MSAFSVADWFGAFAAWLDGPGLALDGPSAPSEENPKRAAFLLEVLSDASNELLAVAVAAAHLRRYGTEKGLARFWARSEWGKWDLTYGSAAATFSNWTTAWRDGLSGELGVIEAKVGYSHQAPSARQAQVTKLAHQLEQRARWHQEARAAPSPLALHGLVFYLDWGGGSESWNALIDLLQQHPGLGRPIEHTCETALQAERLAELWPRAFDAPAHLRLALVEYSPH